MGVLHVPVDWLQISGSSGTDPGVENSQQSPLPCSPSALATQTNLARNSGGDRSGCDLDVETSLNRPSRPTIVAAFARGQFLAPPTVHREVADKLSHSFSTSTDLLSF